MKPVATKPIAGTPWQEVTTDTGHVYWYDGKEAVWEIPEAVKLAKEGGRDVAAVADANDDDERKDRRGVKRQKPAVVVDAKMMAAMRRAKANGAVLAPEYEALLAEELRAKKKDASAGKKKKKKVKEKEREKEREREKKVKKKERVAIADGLEVEDFDVEFDEDEILGEEGEEDEKNDDNDAVVDVDASYRELLREHGVHQFSRYETVEKKVGGDARWIAMDPRKRRTVFEAFCAGKGVVGGGSTRNGADNGVKNKNTTKAKDRPSAAFNALLQDVVKDHAAQWAASLGRLKNDSRYGDAAGELGEGEMRRLFDDHCGKLRVAQQKRKAGERAHEREKQAAERRQQYHSREEQVAHYAALLAEVVRVPGSWDEVVGSLRADPQKRMLADEETARRMHAEHVERLRGVALRKLGGLFATRKFDTSLSGAAVVELIEDTEDVEFLEFDEALVTEAWRVHCGGEGGKEPGEAGEHAIQGEDR